MQSYLLPEWWTVNFVLNYHIAQKIHSADVFFCAMLMMVLSHWDLHIQNNTKNIYIVDLFKIYLSSREKK